LEAVTGDVVRGGTETEEVEGSPLLEAGLLVEVGDAVLLPSPGIASLGEGIVTQVGHLIQDVIQELDLIVERVEAVLIGKEHAGNPRFENGERGWRNRWGGAMKRPRQRTASEEGSASCVSTS
jgi:hypothetical protein